MHRDRETPQITLHKESIAAGMDYTNTDPGYRAVPKISKDDEGVTLASVLTVNRTTGATGNWAARTCGTSGATVEDRIASCAAEFGVDATWEGSVKGNAGQGRWRLVTRTGDIDASGRGREVWRDERTKLLWSSFVAQSLNWCKASGSNFIAGNPTSEDDPGNYCDNATYQNTAGKAVSACFEDGENHFTTSDPGIDPGGKAGLGLTSSPKVAWRLPTRYDYQQADINGIRFVLPEMVYDGSYTVEWSASVYSDSFNRYEGWVFEIPTGAIYYVARWKSYRVRCVGR